MEITIWTGLVTGSIFALVATGFNIAMVPTGVFNFAEGGIVVLGTFVSYQFFSQDGLPFIWVLLITMGIGALVGVLSEVLTVRPLRWLGGGVDNALVTTVGAFTALTGLIGIFWGYLPLVVPLPGPTGFVHFLGTVATPDQIYTVVAGFLAAVLLHLFFRLTRRGQACLAVAEDREPAMLRGINVSVLSIVGFAASGAFGCLVGLLIGPITYGDVSFGAVLALDGFVAVALGGQGSFIGGWLGGLTVGIVATFAQRYVGANYGDIAVVLLLLVAFILRPAGFGGEVGTRSV